MEGVDYRRVRARVARAEPDTAHVTIDSFAGGRHRPGGHPIPDGRHRAAREQLAGVEVAVTVNILARADTDVAPHDWQLLVQADHDQLRAARAVTHGAGGACIRSLDEQ